MMRFDEPTKVKIIEDANGFVTVEGVIASTTDKLIYKDGLETISESALFDKMDDLAGTPVTIKHPKKFLTPETAQQSQVGSITKAWRDGSALKARIKLTAKSAIDAVKGGLRGLSAGYEATLKGSQQVARNVNHLALVSTGRAQSSGLRADQRESFDMASKTVQQRFDDAFFKVEPIRNTDGLTAQERHDKKFYEA